MKHFLLWSRNYDFDTLVSFCDRDLSPDPKKTCYYSYGFKYLGDVGNQLSYYVLDSTLLKIKLSRGHYFRQYFQKHKLDDILINFDPQLTEIENCCNHKIYPIYNSGTHKYILDLKEEI